MRIKNPRKAYLVEMLKIERKRYYQIKEGQTLQDVAETFSVSPILLAKENGLKKDVFVGQIVKIPSMCGNRYVVQEGDTKELLCGSDETYLQKNGTDIFYIGMEVVL